VSLLEASDQVTGEGEGLQLAGHRSGNEVVVTVSRPGGTGQFTWSVAPDGSLVGSFVDAGANNSGSSVGRRFG
jgi:hypothetical protein